DDPRQRLGGHPPPGAGREGRSEARGPVGHHALRRRLHVRPLAGRHARRRRAGGLGPRRPTARARPRVPASAGGAQTLRVEEREVAARPRIHRPQRARVLGGARLPHPRGSLAGGALLVPGGTRLGERGLSAADAWHRILAGQIKSDERFVGRAGYCSTYSVTCWPSWTSVPGPGDCPTTI